MAKTAKPDPKTETPAAETKPRKTRKLSPVYIEWRPLNEDGTPNTSEPWTELVPGDLDRKRKEGDPDPAPRFTLTSVEDTEAALRTSLSDGEIPLDRCYRVIRVLRETVPVSKTAVVL